MPLLNLQYWKYTVFRTFLKHTWHIQLKFGIWLSCYKPQIKFECRHFLSIFVSVMPLFELRTLEIHGFPHFSPTCFDIFNWNFVYDFVVVNYRSSLNVVPFRQFLYTRLQTGRIMVWWCPSGSPSDFPSVRLSVRPTLRPSVRVSVRPFSTLFSYMLWYIELKFCTWLSFNVLQIKFECRHFASIFEGVMLLRELEI